MSRVEEILKQERLKKGLSLEDVSKQTKINVLFLEHIENGQFDKLPSYAHAFGFVKSYASFLKLDQKEIEANFKENYPKEAFQKREIEKVEDKAQPKISKKLNTKYLSIFILGVVFIFLILVYFNGKKTVTDELSNYPASIIDNQTKVPEKNDNNSHTDNTSENVSVINDNSDVKFDPKEIADKIFNDESKMKQPEKVVTLYFNDICWIHMKTDNETDYDFIAEKDLIKNIRFNKFFKIDIGNAASVSIKYKDQLIENLGGYRQPLKNLYFYVNDNDTLIYEK